MSEVEREAFDLLELDGHGAIAVLSCVLREGELPDAIENPPAD
jgi:hypothetical protein